ncbi:MAG: sigma-54 dependent transcriptional regulator [Phycisphaerae bacterium]
MNRILIITRQEHLHKLAYNYAKEVLIADDLREASDIIRTVQPDLIIFDEMTSSSDISSFTAMTDNLYGDIPVVIVNDSIDSIDESIKSSIEHSAGDTDSKQTSGQIIETSLTPAANTDNNRNDDFFLNEQAASAALAGQSQAAKNLLEMIEMIGSSRCNPVLVVGETGTGKEVVAQAIHNIRSPEEQFVAINCAALTANLLESELFGHVKGSFTGADRDKTGLLELAGKGTLFLDEISEMPLELQAKLLRVLQEKTFRKVGGTTTLTCNALIIASSNRNLLDEVENKRFRRDLYYRLSVCPINIQPLRSDERKQDIRVLAEYFLQNSDICPGKNKKIKSLTPMAIEALEKHDWPGNVRELKNVIDRAILFEQKDRIGLGSIIIERSKTVLKTSQSSNQITDFSLAKAEHKLIARALQESGWQKTKAASLLGITRATLYAKVKQYNIQQSSPENQLPENSEELCSNTAFAVV